MSTLNSACDDFTSLLFRQNKNEQQKGHWSLVTGHWSLSRQPATTHRHALSKKAPINYGVTSIRVCILR